MRRQGGGAAQLAHFVDAAGAVPLSVLLLCSGAAEPRTEAVPSREQLFVPACRQRAKGRIAAFGIWLAMVGERPEITFVAPARRWRAEMKCLALCRRKTTGHGRPDGVNQVL